MGEKGPEDFTGINSWDRHVPQKNFQESKHSHLNLTFKVAGKVYVSEKMIKFIYESASAIYL